MIHKLYSGFFDSMNEHNIKWCLIKDYEYLKKNGYDNEIDLVAGGEDRDKIRQIGRKLGWHESALNKFNTHLIFFRFVEGKPYRVDVHLERALATAVPWLKARDILSKRLKKENVYYVSPNYELAILIMSGSRGRKPKKHRIERAKQLKKYIDDAKLTLRKHLSGNDVERYYEEISEGKRLRLSKLKRLGIIGVVHHYALLVPLFSLRLLSKNKLVITSPEECIRLAEELGKSKLSTKIISSVLFYPIFKGTVDVVLIKSRTEHKSSNEAIKELFP